MGVVKQIKNIGTIGSEPDLLVYIFSITFHLYSVKMFFSEHPVFKVIQSSYNSVQIT